MAIPKFRFGDIAINKFPYLIRTKNLVKEITDFPVSFNAELTDKIEIGEVEGDQYLGILKGYERFLTALVTQKFDGLEKFVEHNFLQKTKKSLENLTSKGYKIKQRGDLLYSVIKKVSAEKIYGNVLPYRNLNMPRTDYRIKHPILFNPKTKVSYYKYFVDWTMPSYYSEYDEFKEFDLDSLNKSKDPHSMDEAIRRFLNYIGFHTIYYDIIECSIHTNYKIFVEDPKGKVVAGKNDDSNEYHTIRLEKCKLYCDLWKHVTPSNRDLEVILCYKLMENHLDSYFIIDFDGFMEMNPLVS